MAPPGTAVPVKKCNVQIGKTYAAKVSGKLALVKITGVSPYGGWDGVNLDTHRRVRVKTAARLRFRMTPRIQRENSLGTGA